MVTMGTDPSVADSPPMHHLHRYSIDELLKDIDGLSKVPPLEKIEESLSVVQSFRDVLLDPTTHHRQYSSQER
jgi:hypothetical protein